MTFTQKGKLHKSFPQTWNMIVPLFILALFKKKLYLYMENTFFYQMLSDLIGENFCFKVPNLI